MEDNKEIKQVPLHFINATDRVPPESCDNICLRVNGIFLGGEFNCETKMPYFMAGGNILWEPQWHTVQWLEEAEQETPVSNLLNNILAECEESEHDAQTYIESIRGMINSFLDKKQ